MSRKKVPAYRRQREKPPKKDRAFVQVRGHRIYLGEYGTPGSHRAYQRFLVEWEATGGQLPVEGEGLTVEELCARFLTWLRGYLRGSKEFDNYRAVVRRLLELFADCELDDFGPRCLKVFRHALVRQGLARTTVNSHTNKVRRMFRWAVEEELCGPSVHHALVAVSPLRRGRTDAKESVKVAPANLEDVERTIPHLTRPLQAVVRLQILTGARCGEILCMRPADIDQGAGDVWLYQPERHKTELHGHQRILLLGPRAQEILAPFLRGRAPGQYCFSPKEAMREFFSNRHKRRVTPIGWGNRPGTNRSEHPMCKPGERYRVSSYAQAIRRACLRAGVSPWHSHQLRHFYATRMRQLYDVESARILLGHRAVSTTELYAEQDFQKALEIVRKLG